MKTANSGPKFWIGVASKNHIENGIKLGICQFCHGAQSPAKRLKKGDFVIYHSSKVTMDGPEPYQKFTAIGVVTDDAPYQVSMGDTFNPFRRNINYFDAKHVEIKPLIAQLPFIRVKKSWGAVFSLWLLFNRSRIVWHYCTSNDRI
ncbi:MAG: hypothetical protein QG604_817 [Candidatus Dependentiae bacterium]|nr:hypothetical protein [Candidatus Dependentiae bacterium]